MGELRPAYTAAMSRFIVTASMDHCARGSRNAGSGRLLATLTGLQDWIRLSAAFFPNGEMMRSRRLSRNKTARLWAAAVRKRTALVGHGDRDLRPCSSADGPRGLLDPPAKIRPRVASRVSDGAERPLGGPRRPGYATPSIRGMAKRILTASRDRTASRDAGS